jgi:hypothetical protein
MIPALLLCSAAVLIFIGCAHSYLGERVVFSRLFALPNLPLLHNDRHYTEQMLRFAWHLTSLAWWGLAAVVAALAGASATPRMIGMLIGATVILSGVVIVATAGKRHPAWWLFLVSGTGILAGNMLIGQA